jgi:uncharacterized protein (TIGR02996 family)
MPRYEYIKGSSSKFWEIELQACEVTLRFGRTGTKGQQRVKTFKKSWEANRYKSAQIQSKLKKGYQLVRPGMPGPELEPRAAQNPELEAMIAAAPEKPDGYMVYADWLQAQGDPRGELISVEQALLASPRSKKLLEARARLREPYDRQLLALAEPFGWQAPGGDEPRARISWGLGFIRSAWLGHDYFADTDASTDLMDTHALFSALLSLPSMRLLQELTVGLWRDDEGQCDYGGLFTALARVRLTALRRLFVGDFRYPSQIEISWTNLGDLSQIHSALPRLQELVLQGGGMKLGTFEFPDLRTFEVRTGGLSSENIRSIASARWPKLERLEVWFGDRQYGFDGSVEAIEPILAGEGIPRVRHLGLKNAEFTDAICARLAGAEVLGQLESLDLSMGLMTDEGAAVLAAARPRLRHLKTLDVSRNFLTTRGTALLKGICKEVRCGKQNEPDVWDGEEHRYVSVGE